VGAWGSGQRRYQKISSRKENILVSIEQEINDTTTYLWAQTTLVVVWAPHVSFQLQRVVFEVGAVGVVGGWREEGGKRGCGSLVVMGTIAQSGATLLFGQHT
jgi:hypothetical protein